MAKLPGQGMGASILVVGPPDEDEGDDGSARLGERLRKALAAGDGQDVYDAMCALMDAHTKGGSKKQESEDDEDSY